MDIGGPPDAVRVEVLGPLRLLVGGSVVEVPGPRRRAALALLALAEGRTTTVDTLLRGLWPDADDQPGRPAVQSHISRLRTHLGAAATRLHTVPDGYRLELDGGFDLAEARTLLARSRAGAQHDPPEALELLRRADALWRGPVLADLQDVLDLGLAVTTARQLQAEVIEAMVELSVRVGRADEVRARATAHLSGDPLREQAVLALMGALAADGASAEALRVSREFRERLVEETGLDPSPALGQLEGEIARGPMVGAADPTRRWLAPTTPLVGREPDLRRLAALLEQERLVCLVGPGGVGKSRVAVELGAHHPDAAFVELAPLTDMASIPHALAAALGLSVTRGDTLHACLAVLAERHALVVLDNCEHLLDAARDTVHTLLTHCPGVSVLATSREPLGLTVERVVRLDPLAVPGPGVDTREAAAVRVFLDRAVRVSPEVPTSHDELVLVAEIVRRLDGIPLAIELAAGRLSTLSLPDLYARLDRSLDLLGGGRVSGEARHRTLRNTVTWSYQLLSDAEQRLFRHLSAFADGFDLATAEATAARLHLQGDPVAVLARLVDASMVQLNSTAAPPRYRMLETLRMFGRDRLADAGEESQGLRLLVRWAVDVVARAAVDLESEAEPTADALLRRELGNLRVAWRSARDLGWHEKAAEMVVGLFDVVAYRDLVEVREWATELADDASVLDLSLAGAVLGTAAEAAYQRGDHDRALRLARQGQQLTRTSRGVWYCLMPLSVVALARADYAAAAAHAREGAALGIRSDEGLVLAALASAYAGDLAGARTALTEAPAPRSPSMRAWRAYVEGELAGLSGDPAAAEARYVQAIDNAQRSGATFLVGVATVGLLSVRGTSRGPGEVLDAYREVITRFADTGNWTHLWVTLRNLALLLRDHGEDAAADLIEDAAAAAPDAPPEPQPRSRPLGDPVPGRDAVLRAAGAAIDRLAEVQRDPSTKHSEPTHWV